MSLDRRRGQSAKLHCQKTDGIKKQTHAKEFYIDFGVGIYTLLLRHDAVGAISSRRAVKICFYCMPSCHAREKRIPLVIEDMEHLMEM